MTARTIRFTLNGRPVATEIEPHRNLVELLNRFDLNGARESCGQGLCGCCTVLVDDMAVSGCLYFATWVDGRTVTTVEHLDADGSLTSVQQAFIEAGAFQCGFCTPGFVLMTHQLLRKNANPSDDDIRHYLSGNLCRCAAYPEIIKAVKAAAARGCGMPCPHHAPKCRNQLRSLALPGWAQNLTFEQWTIRGWDASPAVVRRTKL
jgi:carbon-monoxide dehydrogenase small subunit